jgi:hypothetical protein
MVHGAEPLLVRVRRSVQRRGPSATTPAARRVGWQDRLDTPGGRRTFSFDCTPIALDTGVRFALIRRPVSGPVA